MAGCAVKVKVMDHRGEPCGQPGRMYFLGCIHEHAGQRELCDRHAAMMSAGVWCVMCRESREPHECPVAVRAADGK